MEKSSCEETELMTKLLPNCNDGHEIVDTNVEKINNGTTTITNRTKNLGVGVEHK